MYEFQTEGVEFLRTRPRALLGDEPGMGKSRQALLAAQGRTLIVAPAMAHDAGVWTDEIAKWRPELDATLVAYSGLTQRERTPKGGTRPTDHLHPEFARPHWDTLILDEAHYVKGRKTHWTKAVRKLKADRTFLLTGTPIPNWSYELFVPLQLLHPTEAGGGARFGSFWRWAAEWFRVGPTHWSPMEVGAFLDDTPVGWQRFHDENLGGVYLARQREGNLPPLTEQWISIPMVPAQRKVYRELKRDFLTWIGGRELVAWNTAAQTTQLAKAATGLELLGGVGSGKLEFFRELLRTWQRPMLVCCHFRAAARVASEVSRSLGKRTEEITGASTPSERRRAVVGLQDGSLDVLVGTLDTISESLNLQAADCVVFLEHSWRPSRNIQAVKRVHRIGQARPVTAFHLVTRDTIDERIQRVIAKKTDNQAKALRPAEIAALA